MHMDLKPSGACRSAEASCWHEGAMFLVGCAQHCDTALGEMIGMVP